MVNSVHYFSHRLNHSSSTTILNISNFAEYCIYFGCSQLLSKISFKNYFKVFLSPKKIIFISNFIISNALIQTHISIKCLLFQMCKILVKNTLTKWDFINLYLTFFVLFDEKKQRDLYLKPQQYMWYNKQMCLCLNFVLQVTKRLLCLKKKNSKVIPCIYFYT